MPSTNDPAPAIRAEAFVDLVRREARRVHHQTHGALELDELVSMGVEGLFEAMARFDARRNVPFGCYARARIRGRILDSLGNTAGLPRRAWRHAQLNGVHLVRVPASCGLDLLTTCGGPPERLRADLAEALDACRARRALALLPERSADLLRMLYLEGRTLVEAAGFLDVSPSWASRMRDRALESLREHLTGREAQAA